MLWMCVIPAKAEKKTKLKSIRSEWTNIRSFWSTICWKIAKDHFFLGLFVHSYSLIGIFTLTHARRCDVVMYCSQTHISIFHFAHFCFASIRRRQFEFALIWHVIPIATDINRTSKLKTSHCDSLHVNWIWFHVRGVSMVATATLNVPFRIHRQTYERGSDDADWRRRSRRQAEIKTKMKIEHLDL